MKLFIDPKAPGVIRIEGTDRLTGILAGLRAPEIVHRCNAHGELVAAVREYRDLFAELMKLKGLNPSQRSLLRSKRDEAAALVSANHGESVK